MPLEHRQVLGDQRRLQAGLGENLADRCRAATGRQDLEDPDAGGGVGQRLEEIGLDLVERLLRTSGKKRCGMALLID